MTVKFRSSCASLYSSLSPTKLLAQFCMLSFVISIPVSAATIVLHQERFVDSPRGVAIADIDGDNDKDIVVTSFKAEQGAVYVNDGTGIFFKSSNDYQLPAAVEVAASDIDGDGHIDLVIDPELGLDRVLFGDGLGSFRFDADYQFSYNFEFETTAIEIADFNGDGQNDIAFANLKGPNAIWMSNPGGDLQLRTFGNSASFALKNGDLDGDGDLDIVVGNIKNSTFSDADNRVWLNDGSGNFSIGGKFTGSRTIDVQLADLDGDNDLDIVATNDYYGVEIGNLIAWKNNGAGSFSQAGTPLLSGPSMHSSAISDVDNDGDMDVYVSCIGSYKNRLLLNDSSGSFTEKHLGIMDDVNSQNAVFANLNSDNYPDLVTLESVSYVRISLNQPEAPLIAGSVYQTGKEVTPFSYTPTKAHPHIPLAFSIVNKPVWATFNTETGEVSGIPGIGDAGTYLDIIITATDGSRSTTLAPLTIQISTTQDVPLSGLIAHYPMRGNLDDIHRDNHGYSYGATPTKDYLEQNMEAFAFDGIDDHQLIKQGGALSSIYFTWNIWVKTDVDSGTDIVIESNQTDDTENAIAYGFGAGLIAVVGPFSNPWCGEEDQDSFMFSMHSVAGNHQYLCSPNGSLIPGVWQMVTLTVSQLEGKIYIDGKLVASKTVAEPVAVGSSFWIGMRPKDIRHSESLFFKGEMADFLVYGKELSAIEIQQLYQATK